VSLETDLTQRLGLSHPIIKARLEDGDDRPKLVAALCQAGASWEIHVSACEKIIFSGGVRMELVITDSQQFRVEIQPVDKAGNPGTLASVPVWSASDPTILTVAPAADGLSAVVSAMGKLGAAQVHVTAEGDPTSGVNTITGTVDVQVVGGKAVSLRLTVGTATEIPPTAPPSN
jgi:hypothetical protein